MNKPLVSGAALATLFIFLAAPVPVALAQDEPVAAPQDEPAAASQDEPAAASQETPAEATKPEEGQAKPKNPEPHRALTSILVTGAATPAISTACASSSAPG
jgi:hypothetical protein